MESLFISLDDDVPSETSWILFFWCVLTPSASVVLPWYVMTHIWCLFLMRQKSEGWRRSGEVSHTGNSKMNFLWPLHPLQGNKALQVSSTRRYPSLCMWVHMLLHLSPLSWCDHQPHAAWCAKLNAAILSQKSWIHVYDTAFLIITRRSEEADLLQLLVLFSSVSQHNGKTVVI